MSYSGADAEYSFGNSVWTPTDAQLLAGEKTFQTVDATITIYQNDYYDDYVLWLNNGASG